MEAKLRFFRELMGEYKPRQRSLASLLELVARPIEIGAVSNAEFKLIQENWNHFRQVLSESSSEVQSYFLRKLALERLTETLFEKLDLVTTLERSLSPYKPFSNNEWSDLLMSLDFRNIDDASASVMRAHLERLRDQFQKDWTSSELRFLERVRPDTLVNSGGETLSFKSWFFTMARIEYSTLLHQTNSMYFYDRDSAPGAQNLVPKFFQDIWKRRPDLQSMDIATEAGQKAFLAWLLHEGYAEGLILSPPLIASIFSVVERSSPLNLKKVLNEDMAITLEESFIPGFKFFDVYLRVIATFQESLISGELPNMSSVLDVKGEPDFKRREKLENAVTIIGYVRNELGLGEYARSAYFALKAQNPETSLFSIQPPGHPKPSPFIDLGNHVSDEIKNKVNLFCLPLADYMTARISRGNGFTEGIYNIAFAPWEFNVWNSKYSSCFEGLNEVWAISDYSAEAFKKASSLPVRTMPIVINPPLGARGDKKKFGLTDDFTFMFMFDFNSTVTRKNPLGLIRAFQSAFPEKTEGVQLVIKTMYKGVNPHYESQFQALCGNDPRIKIFNEVFPRSDLMDLMDSSDCYVSLHRSEGFGMTLAEAMLLGKPVIATGYSGSLEVANSETAYLVDYTLVAVSHEEYNMSEGAMWADPDLAHAARLMREVRYCGPEILDRKTREAKQYIVGKFSAESASKVYGARLNEILSSS